MADPTTNWDDFNWFIGDYIPRQTIPILRRFASHIEIRTRLAVGIRTGDKKADIVDKIVSAFRVLKSKNDLANYTSIRVLCEQEGNFVNRPTASSNNYGPPPTFGGVSTGMNGGRYAPYAAPAASSSYRPAAPAAAGPSRNGWSSQTTTTGYAARVPILQDWKPNPMWKPIKALTNMEMLPDIGPNETSHTRRDRKVHMTLLPDIIEKLNHSKSNPNSHPQHSVRIFCTSNDFYKPPNTPYSPANALINNQQIPIEYPTNPDVFVDEYPIPFKERGLRGKPGSAPPFDLDRGTKGLQKVAGRMTSVNMGHTGPTVGKKKEVSKKFFFQVVFCEITTSAELQKRIDKMQPAEAQASLGLLRKKQDDDDDIIFGQSRMSLKDPLSYMRLVRPVRSSKCSHLQCFEAKWWIVGNEKHPQWLCPLCNRALRFDELIVDGFSLDILDVVPEKYDEVVIEADNTWHTEDGAYGSPAWLAQNSKSAQPTRAPTPKEETEDTKPDKYRLSTSPDLKGKRKAIEILSSDDEEEEPLGKTNQTLQPPTLPQSRQLSTSAAPSISRPPSAQPALSKPNNVVIDLTLSDSEDDDVEDAVTNFDRLEAAVNTSQTSRTLAPPTTESRGCPSSARSPSESYRNISGEGSTSNGSGSGNGNGNGYNNGGGNDNGNRPESSYTNGHGRPYPPPPAPAATEAARQPTDRYIPAYMPNREPAASFSYNPNNRNKYSNPNPLPYRSDPAPAPAPANSRPVDSWRAGYDERSRKRDRERERDRDMETDSEDEDYRYSRRH